TVLGVEIIAPPVVLSLARKPLDYFTFNAWLVRLPEYLWHGPGSLTERLAKLWSLALFWFSADNPYGLEWGFAVTVSDLARFFLTSVLVATYFALWTYRRDQRRAVVVGAFTAGGQGAVLGAFSSLCGLATGGCTVMGCGAPVIPVVGLAFVGLSSGALAWMSRISTVGTLALLIGMGLGVLYLGSRTSRAGRASVSPGALDHATGIAAAPSRTSPRAALDAPES
ncbi:MAG TPA: hypothetical protein VMS64_19280, partial [Candidatus Methylomirabilis sp.]|nr:hypothetical protein [Candidatus Methylomirabilis sp.]